MRKLPKIGSGRRYDSVDTLTETVAGTVCRHDDVYDTVYRPIERVQTPGGLGVPAQEDFRYDTGNRDDDPADPTNWA